MFEGFAKGRAARKNRWKAPMLASGALVHAVVFTGMWINGIWQIKKVDAAEENSVITLQMEIPRVEEAGRAAPKPPEAPKPEQKKVARNVQPEEKKPEDKPVEVPTTGGNEEAPTTGGSGTEGLPTGTGTTGELPPIPVEKPPPEMPKPPPVAKPTQVQSSKLDAFRISGNPRIAPDGDTAQQIARADTKEVRGTVKLCLSSGGQVSSVTVIKPTGFDAYDAKLEREMRGWRYQPYTVDGVATPVCTMVTFVYRQR